ncbi:MAG TPA: hypothetical protein VFT64_00375 [Rickettsiales bacterium]|nr:hypothetical protein [Rickettsiales bacterium]
MSIKVQFRCGIQNPDTINYISGINRGGDELPRPGIFYPDPSSINGNELISEDPEGDVRLVPPSNPKPDDFIALTISIPAPEVVPGITRANLSQILTNAGITHEKSAFRYFQGGSYMDLREEALDIANTDPDAHLPAESVPALTHALLGPQETDTATLTFYDIPISQWDKLQEVVDQIRADEIKQPTGGWRRGFDNQGNRTFPTFVEPVNPPLAPDLRGTPDLSDVLSRIQSAGSDEELQEVLFDIARVYTRFMGAFFEGKGFVLDVPDRDGEGVTLIPFDKNLDFDRDIKPHLDNPNFWPATAYATAQDDQTKTSGMHVFDALKCLVDTKRTIQFAKGVKATIHQRIEEDLPIESAIDAGTGTSILSMLMAAHGAKQVHAIEINDDTYEITKGFLQHCGLGNVIKLKKGDATAINLRTDNKRLLEKADIFIAECLSTGEMDEPQRRIIDAISKYLSDATSIIPKEAELCATLVRADWRNITQKIGEDNSPAAAQETLRDISLERLLGASQTPFSRGKNGTILQNYQKYSHTVYTNSLVADRPRLLSSPFVFTPIPFGSGFFRLLPPQDPPKDVPQQPGSWLSRFLRKQGQPVQTTAEQTYTDPIIQGKCKTDEGEDIPTTLVLSTNFIFDKAGSVALGPSEFLGKEWAFRIKLDDELRDAEPGEINALVRRYLQSGPIDIDFKYTAGMRTTYMEAALTRSGLIFREDANLIEYDRKMAAGEASPHIPPVFLDDFLARQVMPATKRVDDRRKPAEPAITSVKTLGITQYDAEGYPDISSEGGEGYSKMWYDTIGDEDLSIVAKNIGELYRYSRPTDTGQRLAGEGVFVEGGTGTSLLSAIMSAPFCTSYTGMERSPENVKSLNKWLDPSSANPRWENWREIAAIFYAQAAQGRDPATWLAEIKNSDPQVYNALRNWAKTEGREGYIDRNAKDRFLNQYADIGGNNNPYLAAPSVPALLSGKAKFIVADMIDKVNGDPAKGLADITAWINKADVAIVQYVDESVVDNLLALAHIMNNRALMVKKGGLMLSNMMEGTFFYDGFGKEFRECYGTSRVFSAMQRLLASPYSGSSETALVDHGEDFQTSRQGYSGVTALTGIRNNRTFQNGRELLSALHERYPDIRVVKMGNRYGYCFQDELPAKAGDMLTKYLDRSVPQRTGIAFSTLLSEIKRGQSLASKITDLARSGTAGHRNR